MEGRIDGEGGIRTLDTAQHCIHAFQASPFNHISPSEPARCPLLAANRQCLPGDDVYGAQRLHFLLLYLTYVPFKGNPGGS